jgi:hypothetical protein
MGTGLQQWRGVDHPLPSSVPRLKKEESYTSAPSLGLHGLFWGEIYLFELVDG